MSVENVVEKLSEIDKIKRVIFDETQLELFDHIKSPGLASTQDPEAISMWYQNKRTTNYEELIKSLHDDNVINKNILNLLTNKAHIAQKITRPS